MKTVMAVLLFALLLAGCATAEKEAPAVVSLKTDYQVQLETARAELASQRADRATLIASCSTLLQNRPASDTQYALAAMAVQTCYFMAGGMTAGTGNVTLPAPPVPQVKPDGWDRALQVTDRLVGVTLQVLGLKYVRDVGIVQSNNARDTTIAGYNTFGQMATAGFASNAAIAGQIQAPGAVTTTTNTYTMSGTGVLGSGTYAPITRTCSSGNAHPPPAVGATNPLTSVTTQASC